MRPLGLFSWRRLKGDLVVVFDILPRGSRGVGANLFTLMTSGREWPEAESGEG